MTAIPAAKAFVQICARKPVSEPSVLQDERTHHLIQHRRLGAKGIARLGVLAKHALLSRADESIEEEVPEEEERPCETGCEGHFVRAGRSVR